MIIMMIIIMITIIVLLAIDSGGITRPDGTPALQPPDALLGRDRPE